MAEEHGAPSTDIIFDLPKSKRSLGGTQRPETSGIHLDSHTTSSQVTQDHAPRTL